MVTASEMGIWTDEAWVSGHCARCPLIGRILLVILFPWDTAAVTTLDSRDF
jgi:hypothetical protein